MKLLKSQTTHPSSPPDSFNPEAEHADLLEESREAARAHAARHGDDLTAPGAELLYLPNAASIAGVRLERLTAAYEERGARSHAEFRDATGELERYAEDLDLLRGQLGEVGLTVLPNRAGRHDVGRSWRRLQRARSGSVSVPFARRWAVLTEYDRASAGHTAATLRVSRAGADLRELDARAHSVARWEQGFAQEMLDTYREELARALPRDAIKDDRTLPTGQVEVDLPDWYTEQGLRPDLRAA